MPRVHDGDRDAQPGLLLQPAFGGLAQGIVVGAGPRLAFQAQVVHRAGALDDQLVVAGGAGDIEEDPLHLGGMEVHPADDQHVVAPAAKPGDAHCRATA